MHYIGMIILLLTLATLIGSLLFVLLRYIYQDKVGYDNEPLKFVFQVNTASHAWEYERARRAALEVVQEVYPEILREFNRIDVHVVAHTGIVGRFNPFGRGSNGRPTIGTVDLHRTHVLARLTPRVIITQYYTSNGSMVSVERSGFFHEVAAHVVPYLLGFGIMPDGLTHPMQPEFAKLQRRMFERFEQLGIEPAFEKHVGCTDC